MNLEDQGNIGSQYQDFLRNFPDSFAAHNRLNKPQKSTMLLYQLASTLPILISCFLIISTYTVFIAFYVIPQLEDKSDLPYVWYYQTDEEKSQNNYKLWSVFTVFHLLYILMLISFIKTVFTPPGKTPNTDEWKLPVLTGTTPQQLNEIINEKCNSRKRICFVCNQYKPDRAHHCRLCDRCVLKMDHHCPWVNNCIGFYNYKYFFLTITYSMLSMWTFVGSFWETLVVEFNDESQETWIMFLLMILYSQIAILGVIMTGFWIFHMILIVRGYSTVEYCEKRNVKKIWQNGSLYDLGVFYNFKEALGADIILWLLPFGYRHQEDGFDFQNKLEVL